MRRMDKISAFTVPSRRVGQSGLRGTPGDIVALSALHALAAHTSDSFTDESGRRWFGVRLLEVADLLLLKTDSGAHHRLRRMARRGLIDLQRVGRRVYVAFRPEVETLFGEER